MKIKTLLLSFKKIFTLLTANLSRVLLIENSVTPFNKPKDYSTVDSKFVERKMLNNKNCTFALLTFPLYIKKARGVGKDGGVCMVEQRTRD